MQPTKLVTNMAVLLGANALVLAAFWALAQAMKLVAAVLR